VNVLFLHTRLDETGLSASEQPVVRSRTVEVQRLLQVIDKLLDHPA
jgi:hypothetical protein